MNTTIKGVGKDAPVTTNEYGAKQSELPYRLTLADPNALLRLGEILADGARKYGVSRIGEGWYKISTEDHLDHAISHILAWLAGDEQDDHLEHAQCRIHMALAVELLNRRRKVSVQTRIRWYGPERGEEIGYVESNWGKYCIQDTMDGFMLSMAHPESGTFDELEAFLTVDGAKHKAEQLEADGFEL